MESMSDGTNVLMVEMKTYAVPSTYSSLNLSPDAAEALRHTQLRFLKGQVGV
jgi:hypothetical protein